PADRAEPGRGRPSDRSGRDAAGKNGRQPVGGRIEAHRQPVVRLADAFRRRPRRAEAHHPRTLAVRITFLGTGTSHGVPMIACDCATCRSPDPRDTRLRPSIYVETAEAKVL